MISTLPQLAAESFAYLEARYAYQCVRSNEDSIRWESESICIQLIYDAYRSCEVGLEIGRKSVEELSSAPLYSLGEILGVSGFTLAERPFFQATTEERLQAALEKMSQLFLEYGTRFLINDPNAYADLAKQRQYDCETYAINRNLRDMREEADKAWGHHDYGAVVELYNKYFTHLSPSEKKRLAIAEKYVAQSK